ncbi:MAG: GNAT family N-acetyltransferase [Actinomycetota bacterium]|nr:GNAT family N-acetyltransferase [Actinomycetota bacterium]
MKFFQERLTSRHNSDDFSSGNHQLDAWLRSAALTADRAGTGRTFVWINDEEEVVAFFTLAPHVVRRTELPKRLGHGSPDSIPCLLVARIALHQSFHGQGLGAQLLVEALRTSLSAMKTAGGRLIVVDAVDKAAASFYEHHGFRRMPENPYRLFLKASDAAKSLDLAWP